MFPPRPPMAEPPSIAIYLYEPGDGGLDRVAVLFANHLVQRGVRVELWMTRTEGPVADLMDPAIRVRRVPSPTAPRRLAVQKDHAMALRALAHIPHVDWRLQIAGESPLHGALTQLCEELGKSHRVEFPGFVTDPQNVAALREQADLLLHPSRWKGLPGSIIEALGCGAGVVATDSTPNIRSVLKAAGQHAPLPPGDDLAFARATYPYRLSHALDQYFHACQSLTRTGRCSRERSPA